MSTWPLPSLSLLSPSERKALGQLDMRIIHRSSASAQIWQAEGCFLQFVMASLAWSLLTFPRDAQAPALLRHHPQFLQMALSFFVKFDISGTVRVLLDLSLCSFLEVIKRPSFLSPVVFLSWSCELCAIAFYNQMCCYSRDPASADSCSFLSFETGTENC